jgi:hypothetical protein
MGIKYDMTIGISRRTTNNLYERLCGAKEALLMSIDNTNK